MTKDALPDDVTYDGLTVPGTAPGVPNEATVARMRSAKRLVEQLLDGRDAVISHSPLGPEWSSDIDVYAASSVADLNDAARDAGWICLDGALTQLAYPGTGRWAVAESQQVLGRVEFIAAPLPAVADSIVARIDRKGHVDLRTMMEIRHLVKVNSPSLPDMDTMAQAAAIESHYGGTRLARWRRDNITRQAPKHKRSGLRVRLGRTVMPQLRIGISGVDGSGKSSLVMSLTDAFEACGIPTTVVWTRPGMRLRLLEKLATVAKRLFGIGSGGLADIASGSEPDAIRSRRGALGWIWSVLITLAYLWDVWRRSLAAGAGVVLYDRHLLDAVATIEALYSGVDTRLQTWLTRRLTPSAAATVWLDVPASIATERKIDEVFNRRIVELQLDRYRANADSIKGLTRIDATAPRKEIALDAFSSLAGTIALGKPSLRTRVMARLRRSR